MICFWQGAGGNSFENHKRLTLLCLCASVRVPAGKIEWEKRGRMGGGDVYLTGNADTFAFREEYVIVSACTLLIGNCAKGKLKSDDDLYASAIAVVFKRTTEKFPIHRRTLAAKSEIKFSRPFCARLRRQLLLVAAGRFGFKTFSSLRTFFGRSSAVRSIWID